MAGEAGHRDATDTAFALGLLTLFGRRAPDRPRAFVLTVVIADDLLALVVIALVYSDSIDVMPLIWAAGLFAVALVLLLGLKLRRGPPYFVLGSAMWVVALESGIEPLVVGLAFGLLVWATPAARSDLEHAGKRFREFREQPTPELQRVARESIRTAISPNERLQLIYHPWTSYVIVPLFALANAGITIDGDFLERAADSPITLGVLVGYVAGKPLGIVGTALLVTWRSRGRCRPTVGWGAVAGAGASAGFTVSLLVATLAFDGAQLEEAKAGILPAPSAPLPSRGWCSASSDCSRMRTGGTRCARAAPRLPGRPLRVAAPGRSGVVRRRLGLDVARFTEDLGHVGANRIAQDVEGADLSRVSGTPTFFINGHRHHGAYDIDTLSRAVRAAGARAKLAAA